MHSSLEVFGSLFNFFCCPHCCCFGFLFKVHSLPEEHAIGSTVRPDSRVTELSNKYVVTITRSREDEHYVYIVQVDNDGDGFHQRI